MKRIALFFVLAVVSFVSFGQEKVPGNTTASEHSFVVNRFRNNWFISAGVGGAVYLGQDDGQLRLFKRTTPAFNLSAGKWITPWVGAKLEFDIMQLKGAAERGTYHNKELLSNGFFKQEWIAVSPHMDMMLNMIDLFGKYKEKRVYEPILTAGPGFIVDTKGENLSLAGYFGLINKFRISEGWDINLDLKAALVNNDFDGQTGSRGDGIFSIGVSATYKFKSRRFIPYEPRYIKVADTRETDTWKSKYDAADIRIAQLTAENESLKAMIDRTKTAQPAETPEEQVRPQIIIYFTADSYTLQRKDLIILKAIAKEIKENPDNKYEVCGYADNKTGKESYNEKLRNKRAANIIDTLAGRYGVDRKQLIQKTDKNELNPFGSYVLDRGVTITKL